MRLVALASLGLALASGVSAEGLALETTTPTLAGPAAAQGAALLKLLAALAVVLAAFWLSARAFARFGRGRGATTAGLDVLGSVALGQRERLVVVRSGTTRLVLGVTAQSIAAVHVEPDAWPEASGADGLAATGTGGAPSSRVAGAEAVARALPSGPDFAARLRTALGRSEA